MFISEFSLIIFLNDMGTKSFKPQFISQNGVSTDPPALIELSRVPHAGLPIHNLEALHSPPPPSLGISFASYFWLVGYCFLQSKPPLFWHPRKLGLNGEQIDASNLMRPEASRSACGAQSVLRCKQTVSTICHRLCRLHPFGELHGKSTIRDVYPGIL